MTETYAVRWVVDSGHAWLEVPLDEVICAARDVRPVSGFSYVDERAGFAYLEEDQAKVDAAMKKLKAGKKEGHKKYTDD